MKKILLAAWMILCVCHVMAQVPKKLSFQGYLTDANETPIEGTRSFLFLLFAADDGTDPIWSESHQNVAVVHGLYNVMLGSGAAAFDTLTFTRPYFLEVQVVKSTPPNDVLKPRIALSSAGYSLAGTNADNLRSGKVPNTRLHLNLQDLATDGILSADNLGSGLSPGKIAEGNLNLGAGTLTAATAQLSSVVVGSNALQINSAGDITRIKGKDYSFPINYNTTPSTLVNNGFGALTWTNAVPVSMGGTGSATGHTGVLVGSPGSMTGVASSTPLQYLRRNAANDGYQFATFEIKTADIFDGTITDVDISGTAGIADGKLATISASGKVSGNAINTGTMTGNVAINTSGNITTSGMLTATNALRVGNGTTGNLVVDGFTKLGSDGPSIKAKVFTGTTPDLEGFDVGFNFAPITQSQIISVQAMIDKGSGVYIPEGYTIENECMFSWYMTGTQIHLIGGPITSFNIKNKAYRVVVIYQQ